ncbi:MAG: NAD-dependent epimerase/dehydratase family protein, partial [Alphaproteobacteria bacterium]
GHAARRLMDAGWTVRLLARRPPAHPLWAGRRYQAVPGDLADSAALADLVAGVDAVVHLGGAVRARDRRGFRTANEAGARAVALAARAAGVARTILVSSIAAREPGLSDYAASKRAGEQAVAAVGGDWLVLRPTAVYGPWDTASLVLFKAAGVGIVPVHRIAEARVSFVHVADVARAIEAALATRETGVCELDDGREGGYRWAEVVALAGAALGRPARTLALPAGLFLAAGHAAGVLARIAGRAAFFSPGKAREMMHPDWRRQAPWPADWRPSIGLEQGFAETVAWYRERGWIGARGVRHGRARAR